MRRTYPRLASLAVLALGLLALALTARAGEEKKGEDKKAEKKGEEGTTDQAKLQGAWQLTRQRFGPKELSGDDLPPMTLTVKDDLMTRTSGPEGKAVLGKARFKLDPSKQPRRITLTDEGQIKGAKVVGIYELKGDTFTLATSPPGVTMPPKGFDPKEAGMAMILTFTRAKKK
jgi:uncharacterized protein (TIGR03067 family)